MWDAPYTVNGAIRLGGNCEASLEESIRLVWFNWIRCRAKELSLVYRRLKGSGGPWSGPEPTERA